jgi:hypothetical protein
VAPDARRAHHGRGHVRGALLGAWVHRYIERAPGLLGNVFVGSVLVSMEQVRLGHHGGRVRGGDNAHDPASVCVVLSSPVAGTTTTLKLVELAAREVERLGVVGVYVQLSNIYFDAKRKTRGGCSSLSTAEGSRRYLRIALQRSTVRSARLSLTTRNTHGVSRYGTCCSCWRTRWGTRPTRKKKHSFKCCNCYE